MTNQVDTQKYTEFVDAVTSKESNDYIAFNSRCFEIQKDPDGIPVHRLLTAALGICAEGGEFTEVVKKIVFQGKPVNEDNIFHMKRELGDIMWRRISSCWIYSYIKWWNSCCSSSRRYTSNEGI
jgi:hypothetical protein